MAHQELIPLEAREAWEEALHGIPHGFHHTWEYAWAMRLTTGHTTLLYLWTEGEARLACPLIERPFGAYVDVATPSGLSGFVGSACWSRVAPRWNELARARGYVSGYLGLHPLFEPSGIAEGIKGHNSL